MLPFLLYSGTFLRYINHLIIYQSFCLSSFATSMFFHGSFHPQFPQFPFCNELSIREIQLFYIIRFISNRWSLFPLLSMRLWPPLTWGLTTPRWILGTAPFSSLFGPLCVSPTSHYCHRTLVLWAFPRWVWSTNQNAIVFIYRDLLTTCMQKIISVNKKR